MRVNRFSDVNFNRARAAAYEKFSGSSRADWPGALLIAVLFLSAALSGCSSGPAEKVAASAPAAPQVRSEMLVDTAWLEAALSRDNLVLLHVAAAGESYARAHIPGALFLAWDQIAVDRDGVASELPDNERLSALVQRLGIDENSRLVLYDEEEGILAARAYVTFDYLGLGGAAALLDGQLKKWTAEGRPIDSSAPEVVPSSYLPQFNPGVIASLDEMRQLIGGGQAGACLIDARSEKQYSGEDSVKGVTRGGHIPGAENIPWRSSLVSADNPVLRPAAELRELYTGAGVSEGQPVITYCNTGRSASQAYFVLKYLGYDTRLYDGSFSQWSTAEGTPVKEGADRR